MTQPGQANAGDGSPDYLTDVPYLRTFSNDLAPSSLRLVAALNGFTPPPEEDFDYLELGCGNGDTLVTLAAAYPRGRFVGVDLNPEHVAFGRSLAARGGLTNVELVLGDLESLAEAGLPDFDYVCMFGLLSWISPSKRAAAIALAGAKLKAGGLLFASYNALPGWAAVEPMRRLMLDAAEACEPGATSLERAHRGVGAAKLLRDGGAYYFEHNPSAKRMLDNVLGVGLSYAVHEYFHADWHPMYFADLAREMAASEIYFVGQLPLYLNYRDVAIPAPLLPSFSGITDRIAFESLKDFALNQFFRRDVFVKGARGRSDETTRIALDETRLGTLVAAPLVKRKVQLSNYTLHLSGPIFDELIPALDREPSSVVELARSPALAGYDLQTLRDAVLHLALGDQVVPVSDAVSVAAPPGVRYRVCHPYNRMILDQPLATDALVVLASPVLGKGVVASVVEAVCLRAVTDVEPAERGAWLRRFIAKQPTRVLVEYQPVGDQEMQAAVLENELEVFCVERLPKLVQLGVVAPALASCQGGPVTPSRYVSFLAFLQGRCPEGPGGALPAPRQGEERPGWPLPPLDPPCPARSTCSGPCAHCVARRGYSASLDARAGRLAKGVHVGFTL